MPLHIGSNHRGNSPRGDFHDGVAQWPDQAGTHPLEGALPGINLILIIRLQKVDRAGNDPHHAAATGTPSAAGTHDADAGTPGALQQRFPWKSLDLPVKIGESNRKVCRLVFYVPIHRSFPRRTHVTALPQWLRRQPFSYADHH